MNAWQIKEIVENRLIANGESIEETFLFGTFKDEPNARGIFHEQNIWFLYSIDDKKVYSIKGPFTEKEIIYAISIFLHKSKYFDDYKFGSEAMKVYIHSHYRSVAEAIEKSMECGDHV